jgi:ribonuclease HI
MRVTVMVDASYCPSGCAGYGFWIASERGKRPGGGPVNRRVDTSSAAEMAAIAIAIRIGVEIELIQEGDHVLIQTDCTAAIMGFDGSRDKLSHDERDAKKQVFKIKSRVKFTMSFKHVKGHSDIREARYIANNLCDMRAKEGLRLARQMARQERNAR